MSAPSPSPKPATSQPKPETTQPIPAPRKRKSLALADADGSELTSALKRTIAVVKDYAALEKKAAASEAENHELRQENARLKAVVAKMEPAYKTGFEMRELASTMVTKFDSSIEDHDVCEICSEEELAVWFRGSEMHRMTCPKCSRVNKVCTNCRDAKWKTDPANPSMCLNRGNCDHKFDLSV